MRDESAWARTGSRPGFLSLCTFGRAWTRREDVLEIGIKQGTLAGDLECKRNTLIELLRDLKATGYVQVLRRKYHSVIPDLPDATTNPSCPETRGN